jgi:hypothetical protein
MALSELPVPKKGELTRIGQLKKTIVVGDIVFCPGSFSKTTIEQR